jgi:hypothetical protein
MQAMRGLCAVAIMALAGQAGAQAVDGATARKMVFKPKGVQVTIVAHDFLSEDDRKALAYAAEQQPYYGAIAMSPSEGLISEATLAAANFHDVDSARAKALESCNAARKKGTRPCVIAAEIRPSGWEARPLSLSASATEALRKEYGRGRGEKALAISPSTGKYAVSKGAGAADTALASCAATAGAGDCRIAVADR